MTGVRWHQAETLQLNPRAAFFCCRAAQTAADAMTVLQQHLQAERLRKNPETYDFSPRKDNGQAEGWDDDACCEEDGQLFAGVTGRVRVIHYPPGDAVRDGGQDVEEEQEQGPVFAAKTGEQQHQLRLWLNSWVAN